MIRYIKRSNLLKSTIIYSISDIIGKAIPFILLPIVARYLSTSDFGILTNFSVAAQIFIAVCALNTYSALSVSYHKLDKGVLGSYLSNLIYLISLISIVCFVLTNVFSGVIEHYLGISRLWQNLAIVSAFGTAVFSLYTSLLRMQENVLKFSAYQIFQSLIGGILAVVFVVVMKWNWEGRILSIVLAAVITLLIIIWNMVKDRFLFKRIDLRQIKDAFYFGLPLLPHTLSFWFKSGVDRIIITNLVGLSANGVFSVALTLGGIIGVFTGAFFNAYTPSMFKDLNTIDEVSVEEAYLIKKKLVRITYIFAILLLIVCVSSYFIMKYIIPLLFKGDYLGAIQFIPFLMATLFFEGLYSIVAGYIFYKRKTKILGIITFMSSILQMTMTWFFVKKFGALGAVYSAGIVSIITFIAVFIYTNTLYDLPWRLRNKFKLEG